MPLFKSTRLFRVYSPTLVPVVVSADRSAPLLGLVSRSCVGDGALPAAGDTAVFSSEFGDHEAASCTGNARGAGGTSGRDGRRRRGGRLADPTVVDGDPLM
ncbi:hypothetical protein [Streptomyces sp. NBC_00203]|uniref:hypothetical protein n=1 Tax=Streptomyces sp. NBC_00203 TaxID=2975680 RepID=UPI0038672205